jgi:hypothetical protein
MTDINHATTYEPAYGWDWDDIWGGAVDLVSGYAYPVLRWLAQRLYSNFYVKTGGDDRESGISWTDAWETVNLAMETVLDGKTIHIGYGTYSAEPADNKLMPQNAGGTGIKLIAEKDDGTGQTSGYSAKIEIN